MGKKQVSENSLFKAIDEMRHIVKTAVSKTRSMRKNRTRMQENAKVQPQSAYTTESDLMKTIQRHLIILICG